MEVESITKKDFKDKVLNSKVPVLVDFNADWCGPCRMLRPILDNLAQEKEDIKIVSIDVDEEDELAEEYQVSSIPCLVVIKDGKEINRHIGLISQDEIERLFNK